MEIFMDLFVFKLIALLLSTICAFGIITVFVSENLMVNLVVFILVYIISLYLSFMFLSVIALIPFSLIIILIVGIVFLVYEKFNKK